MRQADRTFLPKGSSQRRRQAIEGWKKAVSRAL
jgi:glycerol kinase